MIKKYFVAFFSLFVVFSTLAAGTLAQAVPTAPKEFPGIKIDNFGQMDERFYRGARPGKKDFQALKDLGINTIIDLTTNTPKEKERAEAVGLRYVNIAIEDKSYPTEEAVAKFIETVNDPNTGVFFIHCAGGRHRTGDMGAVYRFAQGWDYDAVYQEMLNYDFYTKRGHQDSLDFVVDYSKKIASQRAAAAAIVTATGTGNK